MHPRTAAQCEACCGQTRDCQRISRADGQRLLQGYTGAVNGSMLCADLEGCWADPQAVGSLLEANAKLALQILQAQLLAWLARIARTLCLAVGCTAGETISIEATERQSCRGLSMPSMDPLLAQWRLHQP